MKDIYIHLHIFKTAGYTFRYHVQKNLKPDEHLLLTYDLLGISSAKPPKDPKIYKDAAFKYLKSLSKERKEKIKLVHGHLVPYGVHKFFNKTPKYFTWVRNPIDRTVSVYNFFCQVYLNEIGKNDFRKLPLYEDKLLINGKIPPFKKWLAKKYESDYNRSHISIVGYLKEMGYLSGSLKSKQAIKKALDKFYFVGLTKNFDEDSLYFFDKLGMHKYFVDQNISVKKFAKKLDIKTLTQIVSQNKYCEYMFKQAEIKSKRFKLDNPDFYEIVMRKKFEKSLLLPITQPLFAPRQTILRLASRFRKNEWLKSNPTLYSDSVKLN